MGQALARPYPFEVLIRVNGPGDPNFLIPSTFLPFGILRHCSYRDYVEHPVKAKRKLHTRIPKNTSTQPGKETYHVDKGEQRAPMTEKKLNVFWKLGFPTVFQRPDPS